MILTQREAIGAVTPYTSLSAWQAAAGPSIVEDFASATVGNFASPSFGPLSFNGFTLSGSTNGDIIGVHTGTVSTSINYPIPASFLGQNFVSWGNGDGYTGPTTTITFAQPIKAFGFDWFNTDYSDRYKIVIHFLTHGDSFVSPPFSYASGAASSGFFGVVSDMSFSSATISTSNYGGWISDEGFDNVRTPGLDAVPEPSALLIWSAAGLGAAGLTAWRRRRRGSRRGWSEEDRNAIFAIIERGRGNMME